MGMKRNIILITVDDLRADHLSCYGYGIKTSPNIDRLAEKGILFMEAIANGPSTRYCFVPILASNYPLAYGHDVHLPKQVTTIAEIMKKNGYKTGAFNAGNTWISRFYGYDRGFDTFSDFMEARPIEMKLSLSFVRRFYKFVAKYRWLAAGLNRVFWFIQLLSEYFRSFFGNRTICERAEQHNPKVLSWLENLDGDFFLWIHYMDVHQLFYGTEQFRPTGFTKRQIKKAMKEVLKNEKVSKEMLDMIIRFYDSQIEYIDYHMGLLLGKLKEKGILDNTIIIFTSDHGEAFNEHGNLSHPNELYDEQLRVPLIIFGSNFPARVIEDQVSHLDIAPTILDLVGIKRERRFQGQSLLPLINGKKGMVFTISECLVPNTIKRKVAYRTRAWKAILREDGPFELYNLKDDPGERESLAIANPEKAEELRAKILAHLQWEQNSLETSGRDELKEKIRSLKKL